MIVLLLLAPEARSTDVYAKREGLGCVVCHSSAKGGPLTAAGRDYLWSGKWMDLRQGPTESVDPSPSRWSGETVFYGRVFHERVLGEAEVQYQASQSVYLEGTRLFGRDNLNFTGEAYGRAGFSNDQGYEDDTLQLVTAEVDWTPKGYDGVLRLGRHWVTAGVGTHHVDGVSTSRVLGEHFDLDAYAGLPVDRGFGGRESDFLVGGRAGFHHGHQLNAGLSAFYAIDESDPADGKIGADFQLTPHERLDVLGHWFYDWIAERVYDQRLHLVWRASLSWQLSADYSRTVPGLFLPKNSIFSVFSVDRYEEASLTATYRFTERLSTRAFVRGTEYDDDTDVVQVGQGLDVRFGPGGEDDAGVEVAYHDEDREKGGATRVDSDAVFARAYHRLFWTGEIFTALEVAYNGFAGEAYGRDSSFARASLGYEPSGSTWRFLSGVDYLRNPEWSSRYDFWLRIAYRF